MDWVNAVELTSANDEVWKKWGEQFLCPNFHVHISKSKHLISGVPVAGVCFQAEKICLFLLRQEFLLKDWPRTVFFERKKSL